MRTVRGLAVAAVAVLAVGTGAGSTPLSTSAQATSAAVVSYPYHVMFELTYQVEWKEPQGLEGREVDPLCASWGIDRGVTTVTVRDAAWKRPRTRKDPKPKLRRHGMPGHIAVSDLTGGAWATGAAVGWAGGTVQRRWVQSGGPEAGTCPNVDPWRPTTMDCGERRFKTRTGSVLAQERRRLRTLDDLTTVAGVSNGSNAEVLSFSVGPASALYRSCMASQYATEYPTNLGVRVTVDEMVQLRNLQPGKAVTGEWTKSGICDADIDDDVECAFSLNVDWTITRWKPGTRFP